jgi:hypothetical protein
MYTWQKKPIGIVWTVSLQLSYFLEEILHFEPNNLRL